MENNNLDYNENLENEGVLNESEILERINKKINRKKEELIPVEGLGKIKIKELSIDEIKRIQMNNKKNKKMISDMDAQIDFCLNGIVEPDLKNSKLIDSVPNVFSDKDLLIKIFTAGEIQEIALKILKLSGYGKDINEEIEEIKK